jgi:hypothetical protein
MPDPALPPLSFLLEASPTSLHDLELASLNRSANLGKAIRSELEQWILQEAAAMLARWMIENRETLLTAGAAGEMTNLEDVFDRRKSA